MADEEKEGVTKVQALAVCEEMTGTL